MQLRRQLALLIEDNRVVRAVHISSGAGGATPVGSFRVYRKERYSWSVPFKVWLPWASYFTGGVAFHEFGSVPTYAASHGCIRVNHYDAADAVRLRRDRHAVSTSSTRRRRMTPAPAVARARRRASASSPALVGCAAVAAAVLVALGLPAEGRADDAPPPAVVRSRGRPSSSSRSTLGDPVLQAGVVRTAR